MRRKALAIVMAASLCMGSFPVNVMPAFADENVVDMSEEMAGVSVDEAENYAFGEEESGDTLVLYDGSENEEVPDLAEGELPMENQSGEWGG